MFLLEARYFWHFGADLDFVVLRSFGSQVGGGWWVVGGGVGGGGRKRGKRTVKGAEGKGGRTRRRRRRKGGGGGDEDEKKEEEEKRAAAIHLSASPSEFLHNPQPSTVFFIGFYRVLSRF